MKLQAFSINEWIYPDSQFTAQTEACPVHTVRNADACFQLLTDLTVPAGTPCTWQAELPAGVKATVLELRPVLVSENSDPKLFTTLDYESCKDFVTRQAPFQVFDRTRPMEDGCLEGGPVAFFVRVDVSADANVGKAAGKLTLNVGGESAELAVELDIHRTVLCPVKESPFSMGNWIYPERVCDLHGVERFSEEYYDWFRTYLRGQIDARNTHFQLPTAQAIRDDSGKVIGFDFTENERIGKIALEEGFRYIFGGFVAHWDRWDAEPLFLVWNKEISTDTAEGFRQLKLYFKGTMEMVERNGWQKCFMQGLVDEPQLRNTMSYRALTAICRKELPCLPIIDPVEAPELYGACDIWVVKQAIYDKYKEQYEQLQAMGEEMWVYSCGFPSGKWMNRVVDLPLTASRLITWMGVRCNMTGYLHWGYHCCKTRKDGMDPLNDACYPLIHREVPRHYPPGNHSVLYMDKDHLYESVRAHVMRKAGEDAELLLRLKKKDAAACNAIIDSVCTNFEEYTFDPAAVDCAERELLKQLDRVEA